MAEGTSEGHRVQKDRRPELKGTVTHENLLTAFSTDAKTMHLYGAFARIAEIEGCPEAARLLAELAESQAFLTDGHLDFLRHVGDPITGRSLGETVNNLAAALAGEIQDASEDLPNRALTAHAEGFADVASWFETLAETKRLHAARFREALELTLKDSKQAR